MTILPDVLAPGLAVVFCGTAVSTVSALRGAYYAGPGNAFWPTLFKVGLTPRLLAPAEYQGIKRYGLGLTDIVKTVSGADVALSGKHFDSHRLRKVVLKYRPRVLAFTSKRAAREFVGHPVDYGVLREKVGETILFVLPSPSGAARRYWRVGPWRELAQLRVEAKLVDKHQDDLITSRLNEIYGPDQEDSSLDAELALLQHRTLARGKR